MRPRRAHRQDGNHAEIRDEFLRLGFTWMDTYQLGSGKPDGVAGYGGLSLCIEIKDSTQPPSKRGLTDDEKDWHKSWTGGIRIVSCKADVAVAVETMIRWHKAIQEWPF